MANDRFDFIHRNRTRLAADVITHEGKILPKGMPVTLSQYYGSDPKFSIIFCKEGTFHALSVEVEKRVGEKYIVLERGEGPFDGTCGKPVVVHTFEEASMALAFWAQTAPAAGGYDKTDFVVVWHDGETYEGRVDLKRDHISGYDLRAHIRQTLAFYSGTAKAPHLTDERYAQFLKNQEQETPGAAASAAEALARYDI